VKTIAGAIDPSIHLIDLPSQPDCCLISWVHHDRSEFIMTDLSSLYLLHKHVICCTKFTLKMMNITTFMFYYILSARYAVLVSRVFWDPLEVNLREILLWSHERVGGVDVYK
jgi:hypothetical protein